MRPDEPPQDHGLLSQEEVHRILERAVRLDTLTSDAITVEQLSAAAAEAGISQRALAIALREVLESRQLDVSAPVTEFGVDASEVANEARRPRSSSIDSVRAHSGWFAAGAVTTAAILVYVIAAMLLPGWL